MKCPSCESVLTLVGGANAGILDRFEHSIFECSNPDCKIRELTIIWEVPK